MRQSVQVRLPTALVVEEIGVAIEFVPAPIYLTLLNTSSDSTAMLYGRCSFAVRGYATAARTGPPQWVRVLPAQSNCTADMALVLPVQAHARTFHTLGSISATLLQQGYYLTLVFQVLGEASIREIPIAPIAVDVARPVP